MQRNGSKTMGLALGIGFLAQTQQRSAGIPIWIFLLLFLLVVVVAVIWVLYEEKGKAAHTEEEPQSVTEVPSAEPEASPATLAAEPPPGKLDDLKRIEGIGPKISGLLQAAGIRTFAQLAETDVSRLKQILEEADITALADPTTWPEQARLAAAGDWEGLTALQDRLKGGRRV